MVNKITSRIRVAYSKHLSYAGRLQIIMVVLFSMYNTVCNTLKWIKRRRWKQFQKEIVASVLGAMIYYTWQTRNRKIFQQASVQPELVITQIEQEICQRVYMLKEHLDVSFLFQKYVIRCLFS